ncbi:MAG: HDOD domain-containing protein [Fusobacteriaceae bacterium]|nr:HDOD domain-containing protein [Fusobacteriaceae bacterium]MBU9917486.1 HDOD domain-containing protein [Fusobacteriaceae bacterium]
MAMSMDEIKKKIEKIDQLPTLPIIITELLGLLDNPKSTPREINELIKNDQALTSKTLRLVNSSYYGFPRKIATVTESIVILGFDTVRNLAVSAGMVKLLKGKGAFDKEKFWHHTVAVAFMSKLIAQKIKYQNAEVAFVSGLLHDITKVFEDLYFNSEFLKALQLSKDSGKNLNEAEVETLGYDHGAIGKRLGDSWNLPKPIVAAIAYHHDIEKNIYPEHEQLVAIVSLADTLVRLKKIGDSGNYGKTLVSLKMMNILKLTKEQIPVIIKEFDEEIKKGSAFLDLLND